jgi:hypothetical protein
MIDLIIHDILEISAVIFFVVVIMTVVYFVIGGKDAAYNRNLYKTGQADESKKVSTTIGWRRDPWNGNDGFTKVQGHTPSGNDEYERQR